MRRSLGRDWRVPARVLRKDGRARPDLFGTQQFGRAAKVSGETGDLQQIGCLGVLCQVPDQHAVLHAFAEQCHGGPPGNSEWSARSGTSMLLQACSPPRYGPAPDNRPHGTPAARLRFPPTAASAVYYTVDYAELGITGPTGCSPDRCPLINARPPP